MAIDSKYLIAGLIMLSVIVIGGVTYEVYDTGEELTCRTNKPIGWEIISQHDGFYQAKCPYSTKDPVYAFCKAFRATGSYQRYGCDEVTIIEQGKQKEPVKPGCIILKENCHVEPKGCQTIECR